MSMCGIYVGGGIIFYQRLLSQLSSDVNIVKILLENN